MAKTAGAPLGPRQVVQRGNLHQVHLTELGNYHLGDTLSWLDFERFLRKIDQDDPDLTTIVGVNGAGSVQHGDAVFEGQSAPWTNLRLTIGGQLNEQSRRNQLPFKWLQNNGF